MYEVVNVSGFNFGRINKRQARKNFKRMIIYVCPCKMRPDSIICNFMPLSPEYDFDIQINAYEYYNCNNEVGRYCSYWVYYEDEDFYKNEV